MFVLRDEDTFDWTVKAKVPQDGKKVAVQFLATFRVLDQPTIDRLVVDKDSRDIGAFLTEALVRFTGLDVQDSEGNPVTEDDERNEIIRKNPLFIEPLLDAFGVGVLNYKSKN